MYDKILDEAADYLEFGPGWRQGGVGRQGRRMCALGAVGAHVPAGDLSIYHELVKRLVVAAGGTSWSGNVHFQMYFHVLHAGMLADWNDQEGRTKEEVIDLFRTTAKRIREEASHATS